MSNNKKEIELGFDEVTSLSELRKGGIAVPMITFSKAIEPTNSFASKHSLSSMVKVSDILIDYSYQRTQNKAKVAKIARNFNYNALGVVIVSIRESGEMFVLDGGHRIAAMNLIGKSEECVDALVYFDLTIEQEAAMFVALNEDRTKPKRADIFDAKVLSGDDSMNEIDKILSSMGLKISATPVNNSVRAVSGVIDIYTNAGPEILRRVLNVTVESFGRNSSVFNKMFMTSLAIVYHHFGDDIDDERLIERLKMLGDPMQMVLIARNNIKMKVYKTVHIALIHMMINEYNKRLRINSIEIDKINKINPSRPWDRK